MKEFDRQLSSHLSRKVNALLEEAVCKHLSLDKVNFYDYINRMSKMERDDLTIDYFDGVPILSMQVTPTVAPLKIGYDLHYKFGV